MDLFEYMRENNKNTESPLAMRLRPETLDEMVGQSHIIGKDKLLYRAIKADKLSSVIFYGPPGTGKTSAILAMGREIFEEHFPSRVIEFNASDDRGIGAVREKISNEAKKYVSEIVKDNGKKIPPYKIIILYFLKI